MLANDLIREFDNLIGRIDDNQKRDLLCLAIGAAGKEITLEVLTNLLTKQELTKAAKKAL